MQQKYNSITICNKTYQIVTILGEGSFGKVYLGLLGTEKYAIKAQQAISKSEWDLLNLLKTKHFRNLVNTYDIEYNQYNRKTYVVMEHCEQSLYDEIQKKTIAPQDIRYVMKQIAVGIKELHDLNFAHRDLKPENILIKNITANDKEQKIYKICNFGTTKEVKQLQTIKIGTPYYFAPEQIDKSFGEQTQKVDIWAFGALTYELLTNEPLFNGMTADEIYDKILTINIESKLKNKINIDRKWQSLLLNMLNRNQNLRYDINKIIQELERNASVRSQPSFKPQQYHKCITEQSPQKTYTPLINKQPYNNQNKFIITEQNMKQQQYQITFQKQYNNHPSQQQYIKYSIQNQNNNQIIQNQKLDLNQYKNINQNQIQNNANVTQPFFNSKDSPQSSKKQEFTIQPQKQDEGKPIKKQIQFNIDFPSNNRYNIQKFQCQTPICQNNQQFTQFNSEKGRSLSVWQFKQFQQPQIQKK